MSGLRVAVEVPYPMQNMQFVDMTHNKQRTNFSSLKDNGKVIDISVIA